MINLNFKDFPILTTERLTLRQITDADAKEIFELRSNESVNKFLDRPKARSIEDAQEFIEKISHSIKNNESIMWGIVFKNQPTLMGTICLYNISTQQSSAEIGYELIPVFQGKGIIHEVLPKVIAFGFEIMQLKIIEAHTIAENERSLRVLEKNNFVLSGKFETENGEPANTLIYSLDNKNK